MPSPRFEPQYSNSDSTEKSQDGDGNHQPDLMDRVLRETQSLLSGSDSEISPKELELLQGVARDHQGQDFTADPIARELVHAMLLPVVRDDKVRAAMSQKIAGTICDDPTGFEQLKGLWEQLIESTR